ncbi:unnamed protein product [Brassica rapa]|uniref:Uncharacterized protein n=1 Tax=Brassica campestris TaxID=3711 RepID=A0A3P6BCC0_BRACM|nr:unnamed protein product [Brassica rapa]VDD02853.1 unnamed protein product [Brassica rapa]
MLPLVQLLHDPSPSVQVAVLGALRNIVLDSSSPKLTFIEYGEIKQLIELSKSMDANTRCSALRALGNLMFLADNKHPESLVQEQALALLRNLVDGCINSIEFVFEEDGLILDTVGRQLRKAPQAQMAIEGIPSSPGALDRHVKLWSAVIILQLKIMVNDPCLDVKVRIKAVLGQSVSFGDS